MKLDLREGLPRDWKLEDGTLFMLNPTSPQSPVLMGPSYVYQHTVCDQCSHVTALPWPLPTHVAVFCRKCKKEFFQ